MCYLPARRSMRGVTLVELIIALAVVAILSAIALPGFQGTLRSNRLTTGTNQLVSAVALARSEAIRNTRGSGVCASANGTTCANASNWTSGWMVWSDVNGNGTFDAGTDTALRYMQGNARLQVTGPASAENLRFDPRGRLVGGQQNIILQPDACGGVPLRRTVTVSPTGQVRKNGGLATCQ